MQARANAARSQSSADLAGGIVEDAQRIVKLEIELAKTEAKELAISNAVAAGLFAAAGLLALIAILVAVPVLIVTLLEASPWAAAGWVVIYLVAAAVMALIGRSKLRLKLPEKTVESVKETKEWIAAQLTSRAKS